MEFIDFLIGIVICISILFIILYLISYFGQIQYEFKIIKNNKNENFEISPKPFNINSTFFKVNKINKGELNRIDNNCEKNQQIRKKIQDQNITNDVISKSIEKLNENVKQLADTESKLIEKFDKLENLNKKTLDTICENNKINKINVNPYEVMINSKVGTLKNIPNETMLQQLILNSDAIDQYYRYINPQPITTDDKILASNYNLDKYFANPLEYENDALTKSVKEDTIVKATNE